MSFLTVITLNVNRLSSPIKKQIGKMDLKKEHHALYADYKRLTLDPKTQAD